jgi:hypothetical protein
MACCKSLEQMYSTEIPGDYRLTQRFREGHIKKGARCKLMLPCASNTAPLVRKVKLQYPSSITRAT